MKQRFYVGRHQDNQGIVIRDRKKQDGIVAEFSTPDNCYSTYQQQKFARHIVGLLNFCETRIA